MTNAPLDRLARALLSVLGAVALTWGPAASTAALNETVAICHQTDDVLNPWVVITVSTTAWAAHATHGDRLVNANGTCFVEDDDGLD